MVVEVGKNHFAIYLKESLKVLFYVYLVCHMLLYKNCNSNELIMNSQISSKVGINTVSSDCQMQLLISIYTQSLFDGKLFPLAQHYCYHSMTSSTLLWTRCQLSKISVPDEVDVFTDTIYYSIYGD